MADGTLKPTTPVLAGVAVTAASGVITNGETMTISATTAQSALNLSKLAIIVSNTTSAAVTLSLAATDVYSGKGIGPATSISIGTSTTVVIGGKFFESARFLKNAGTLVFTQTGASNTTWTAVMLP